MAESTFEEQVEALFTLADELEKLVELIDRNGDEIRGDTLRDVNTIIAKVCKGMRAAAMLIVSSHDQKG